MERRGIRESGHARRDTDERNSLEARGDEAIRLWAMGGRYPNYSGQQTKKGGHTRLQVEAIEEYLLGMYAEG